MIQKVESSDINPCDIENDRIRFLVEERLAITRRERAETRDKLVEVDALIKRHGDTIHSLHPHPQSARTVYAGNKSQQYYSYSLSAIEEDERKTVTAIKKLETLHATTPQSNQLERQFMRDMEKLRQQKKALNQCAKVQFVIEELRDRKSLLQQVLKEKEQLIEELNNGLRRVLTAISLNCHTTDIVEQEFVYSLPKSDIAGIDSDESKGNNFVISSLLGRIVGKGGAHIHSIETQFGVNIDINPILPSNNGELADSSVIRLRILIMGNRARPTIEDSYAAIVNKIESVRDTAIEQVPISSDALACLQMHKRKRFVDLQARHHQVQLDVKFVNDPAITIPTVVSTVKGKHPVAQQAAAIVRLSGFLAAVHAAKSELLDIQRNACSADIDISGDPKILPVLFSSRSTTAAIPSDDSELGLNGEAIVDSDGRQNVLRNIEDECEVHINVSRESLLVDVRGLRAGVTEAVRRLNEIIFANKEVEEELQLERYLWLSCLLGKGGNTLRILTKFLGVRISAVDDTTKKTEKVVPIKIKGTYNKVKAAIVHIHALIEQYMLDAACIEIREEYLIPIVLGKGGTGINSIREKFPGTDIDIEANSQGGGCRVFIHHQSAETVKAAKLHIESILEANFEAEFRLSDDCAIQLKSHKGVATRNQLIQELGLMLHIDKSNQFLKLRGLRSQVEVGLQCLRTFCDMFRVEKMPCLEEDYLSLSQTLKGADGKDDAEGSMKKKIESAFDVAITFSKKDLYLRVQGEPAAVGLAVHAVEQFVSGAENGGSVLIHIGDSNNVSAALIGKAGANIKRIEDDFNVKCDLLQSKKMFRIFGDNERIKLAKQHVIQFINNLKVTESIQIASLALSRREAESAMKLTADVFNVEVIPSKTTTWVPGAAFSAELRGSYSLTRDAKEFLFDRLTHTDQRRVPLRSRDSYELALRGYSTRKMGAVSLVSIKAKYPSVDINLVDATASSCLHLLAKGDEKNTAAAVGELVGLLETVNPTEFVVLRTLHPTFLQETLTAHYVMQLSEAGVSAVVDRLDGLLYLSGSATDLLALQQFLTDKFEEWKSLNAEVSVEEFMLPLIVGKNGATISAWTEEAQAGLQINKRLLRIEVKAASAELLQTATQLIRDKVEALRRQHWQLTLSAEHIGIVIGKQGAVINKIRAESGAHVDVDAATKCLKVTGKEAAVCSAREAIQTLLRDYEQNKPAVKVVGIPIAAYSTVIGSKGGVVREIEAATSVRLDLERATGKCTVKGNPADIETALAMLDKVLLDASFAASGPYIEPAKVEPVVPAAIAVEAVGFVGKPREKNIQLSKSAMRRRRREMNKLLGVGEGSSGVQQEEEVNEEGEEDHQDEGEADSEGEASPAPVVAPLPIHNPSSKASQKDDSAQSSLLVDLLLGKENTSNNRDSSVLPSNMSLPPTSTSSLHHEPLQQEATSNYYTPFAPSPRSLLTGPPPGLIADDVNPNLLDRFHNGHPLHMTLGLGGLGLGDYNGSLHTPSTSNSNAALDLLLGPAGCARGPEPATAAPAGGSKDYFKSKSGLLIRL